MSDKNNKKTSRLQLQGEIGETRIYNFSKKKKKNRDVIDLKLSKWLIGWSVGCLLRYLPPNPFLWK